MSTYYTPQRQRNLYDPASTKPFRLSRAKIELFLECPHCFYLDRRSGVGRVPGFPFALNSAVDTLLKKEFDVHRAQGTAHPLMTHYGIDAVPFAHDQLDEWRDALRGGLAYIHPESNFLVTGGIDDAWQSPDGRIIVVDYKATSKEAAVSLDAPWQISYKRQVEVYQWLFAMNGFSVHPVAYFVYCNGRTDREAFDGKLEFDVVVLPYEGSTAWIPETLVRARECLSSRDLPEPGQECDWCAYRAAVMPHEG
jgi:hypothetical protein